MVKILSQNSDLLAVDKPVGLAVHNDAGNLLLQLEPQWGKLFPVHRLDKETSGVQVLARNERAARRLAEEFQSRTVVKIYHGLLRGELKESQGVWSAPLTDRAEGRRQPDGRAQDRVPCETRFRVLNHSKYFTLCEFRLLTGRQHQIRKHAALKKHHLVGDGRYGDPRYNEKMAELYKTTRMFLHCHRLEIADQVLESPTPQEFMVFS